MGEKNKKKKLKDYTVLNPSFNPGLSTGDLSDVSEAQKYISLALNVTAGINILFDSKSNVIDCNTAALELLGFDTVRDLQAGFNERIGSIIPPTQPDGRPSVPLAERFATAARDGRVTFRSTLNIGGKKRTLDVVITKIPYGNDFAIVTCLYDLTDLINQEKKLKEAQDENELRLSMLNAVVRATNMGVWDVVIFNNDPVDPRNVFTWSDKFRRLLGYKNVNDFPNTFEAWAGKLHPDDVNLALNCVAAHMKDKSGKTPYEGEFRLMKKNGEYGYFRTSGESIRDKDGNVLRIAGAIMDVTETRKTILSTEEQKISALAASEAKSSFLSNMSHEIRTPLNAIIGMTSIGKASTEVDKKDYALDRIDSASKHLLGIINDILDMSKIEANKLVLSPISFVFEEMLGKVVDIVEHKVQERNQKLRINLDKKIPAVLIGDDQRLSQVIANLLSNAVKFTPEGGLITLKARLISEKDGMCRLKISVADTGIGMSDEQMQHLFEPFEQADASTSRSYGGSGLGLSISKRIVDLMDGDIWVDSEVEKGSTFTFTVSLLRDFAADESARRSDDGFSGSRMDFSGYTIMVVEDIDINREILQAMLSPLNLNIECAENGSVAIDMYVSAPKKYDAIFMDVHMPVMDGLEATQRIRSFDIPGAGKIPIIAMTANVFREDIEKCLEAGMNGHIGKPINVDDVVAQLKKFLKPLKV